MTLDDSILTRVSIDSALDQLTPLERDILRMWFAYDQPADYDGQWPPTLAQIGRYVGTKHGTKPLSEGKVAKLRDGVLERWRHGLGV